MELLAIHTEHHVCTQHYTELQRSTGRGHSEVRITNCPTAVAVCVCGCAWCVRVFVCM